jgi:hypothetical protein
MYYICFLILIFSVRFLRSFYRSTAYEEYCETMVLLNGQYISAVFLEPCTTVLTLSNVIHFLPLKIFILCKSPLQTGVREITLKELFKRNASFGNATEVENSEAWKV